MTAPKTKATKPAAKKPATKKAPGKKPVAKKVSKGLTAKQKARKAKVQRKTRLTPKPGDFNSTQGVGFFIRELIRGKAGKGETVSGQLDATEIVMAARKRFPQSNATPDDVSFHKTILRKAGYTVPRFRTKAAR